MSEQVSISSAVSLPSVAVDLAQLNAFNQYIVSRTSVMLTIGGLAAAVGGIIERLHSANDGLDIDQIAPGIPFAFVHGGYSYTYKHIGIFYQPNYGLSAPAIAYRSDWRGYWACKPGKNYQTRT